VRVPDEAGPGRAKVTISFDGWALGNVRPATVEVPVVDPKPEKATAKE